MHTNMKSTLLNSSKFIFSLLVFFWIGSQVYAGGGKYEQKMGETLGAMAGAQSPEDFQNIGNQFLVVAKAEKTEWLPYYYHAYSYIIACFMYEGQLELQDQMLDEAEASIKEMMDIAPDNAEVHALNAFQLMARLAVNPEERGQSYSMKTQMAIGQGMAFDPTNPRLRYVKLSTDMGTARFFGSDTSEYCEAAARLASEWDSFEAPSPIHPNWGKDQVLGMIQQNCNSEN